MILKDYLSEEKHKRRVLIVSDIARGQALIRIHEKRTGAAVRNVNCMTIGQMTDILYRYILSSEGYNNGYELLDDKEALMLFRGILINNIDRMKFFNSEKMLDLATTREIFNKANLIRTNGWNGEERKEKNDRIEDLKFLISGYEDKLAAGKLMDRVSKETFVLEKLKAFDNVKDELDSVFFAETAYLSEDTEYFNGIESELLSILKNAADPVINAFDTDLSFDSFLNCKGKASFYKGYGSFNEASFVANDIFENKHVYANNLRGWF